ncbi:MAG: heparinase II/III family protein [Lentisphaeria bacterium]|nr:heparinase II/III family protein [Lentisphaeria bacterium]
MMELTENFLLPEGVSLLDRLDPERSELKTCRDAVKAGDYSKAEKIYIAHFRQKTINSGLFRRSEANFYPMLHGERDPNFDTRDAEKSLSGFFFDGYASAQIEGEVDWHNAPLGCLARFPVISPVMEAHYHTRDPKYLDFALKHIEDYMSAWPMQTFSGTKPAEGWISHYEFSKPWYWCMLPCRLWFFNSIVQYIRQLDDVSDATLMSMLTRLYQEGAYLREQMETYVNANHNGGAAMIDSMLRCCHILDDFTPSQDWRQFDAEMLFRYIRESFYKDGVFKELTLNYWQHVSCRMQTMVDEMPETDFTEELRDYATAMVTAAVGLHKPTGAPPPFGDRDTFHTRVSIYTDALERRGVPWAGHVLGESVAEPPFKNWPLPGQDAWCGYYTMRNDWSEQANYMAIDGGAWGTDHKHGDKLSFVVSSGGADFLIDPSSTTYAASEPDTFISLLQPGFLHNSITIDGVDVFINSPLVTDKPLTNPWIQEDNYVLFASDYCFEPVKPVRWERRVLFVNGSYWLVQDVITGDLDTAMIEQNFQFDAEIEVSIDDQTIHATAENGSQLSVVPLMGDLQAVISIGDRKPHKTWWPRGEKETDVLYHEDGNDQQHGRGWTGRLSHKLIPAPAVTYTGQATLPLVLTVAIIPGDVKPKITSEQDGDETVWHLPYKGGSLLGRTSLGGFENITVQ